MAINVRCFTRYGMIAIVTAMLLSGAGVKADTEEPQAVVLMYHHFGVGQHPSTNVRLEQFDAHLDYIAQAGYRVWPLTKVVAYLRQKKPFPGRVIAITIDDAYRSVFEQAYPRLRKHGWPFTVFVSTDGVDKRFRAYMSWQQMRDMQAHGASFENHSATHDYLIRRLPSETDTQWQQRMQTDISRAQRRIEAELGVAPTLFAYPYGEFDDALADLVSKNGLVAFGQQSGPVGFSSDLRALPRFPMAESFAALPDVKQKLRSLAFPIQNVQPWSPVIAAETAPRLQIELGESEARLAELTCFVSGQGAVSVQWLDRKARRFVVQAKASLPGGRSRYNCTAPSSQPGRYFWYSHLWIAPK